MAEYSSLPEVTPWEQRLAGQRGLHGSKEVVAGHEEKHVVEVTGKEVVGRHEEKYLADAPSRHADSSALPESLSTMMAYASANDEDKGTKSGRSRRAVKRKCCIVVAVVLIAIVLGVGLGVGLSVGLKSNGYVTNMTLLMIERLMILLTVMTKLRLKTLRIKLCP